MYAYPARVARPIVDPVPRTSCGGLALPPQQLPPPPPRTIALEPTADPVTSIVAGIAGAVAGALDAIRRTVAKGGFS